MQAFTLVPDMKDKFSGGSINCSPLGHSFDIGKALEDGDGVIVTDDDIFAQVLRQYPALESAPVPDHASPVEVPGAEDVKHARVSGPSTLQSGIPVTPTVSVPQGEGEIPAEHKDESQTPEEEVKAGEAVSGTTGGQSPPLAPVPPTRVSPPNPTVKS